MNATDFIGRWRKASGSELANAQLFVTELCELLELPRPEPANEDVRDNAYVFERRVQFKHGDGSESEGRIDCYRRGAFVLESKKIKLGPATRGFDEALLRARSQGESYARALPAPEGRPPFVVVVDIGHVIELYSEFSRSGATYTPFPDPRSHRIRLEDLARDDIRERLRKVWMEPGALDPSKLSAQVTREVATELARLAKALEAAGHAPELVAGFLTRCLFTFFAEDVGLLPQKSFEKLLEELMKTPRQFVALVGGLWAKMDVGGYSAEIRAEVKRFNGKLFKHPDVLPLDRAQIEQLHACATKNWNAVEPAIIGTLLERALNPLERHKLGAHYTPRAYVERLVLPTVIEPLRSDWAIAQAAALTLLKEGKTKEAEAELRRFHHSLCNVRVLDPACGSGNFLYVTLEHLKRLEGEVLNQLAALSGGQDKLETQGLTVDPHQLLGIEINPRAATLAEVVLWIGFLQWHFRTRGASKPPLPVLKDYGNIQCCDAVLAYDSMDYVVDERGVPVTRWDGRSYKKHPVTGEDVPNESARTAQEHYLKPRQAAWPTADFIVGNPPFIGASTLRRALGDGYAEALREVWDAVPESADFVMYWWHHAATLTRRGALRQFGFITTNSLRQTFNRRVVEHALNSEPPLSLAFAIPDHPWVDSADGAAVRIAMTVGAVNQPIGRLDEVIGEQDATDDSIGVMLRERRGVLHADLSIGADVTGCLALIGNEGINSPGVKLHGAGFIVTPDEAAALGLGRIEGLERHIRNYRNGRDLADRPRGVKVIDLFGLTADQVRERYPEVYQRVVERVKPERDANNRATYRDNWWIFGEPRRELRPALAGLPRYIATVETTKHRSFQFLDASVLPDNMLIAIALSEAFPLGVLSSRVHVLWSLAAGGRLGIGNDPRYSKTRCFDPFPFPNATSDQQAHIAKLAEAIDAHRKRQQAAHGDVTLTGLYNVLEKLRSGEDLSAKEHAIHEHGLVNVLSSLHDELDAAVLDAYGWNDLAPGLVGKPGGTVPLDVPDEAQSAAQAETLTRLVALNVARTLEEARGLVRWLRPEFQNPSAAQPQVGAQIEADVGVRVSPATLTGAKLPWPSELPAQVRAVADVVASARIPLSVEAIAARFSGKGAWKKRLPQLLDTLSVLGRVHLTESGYVIGT